MLLALLAQRYHMMTDLTSQVGACSLGVRGPPVTQPYLDVFLMFGLGVFELIIIGVVGLLIFGAIAVVVISLGGRER